MKQQGIALAFVLFVLAVVAILVAGSLVLSSISQRLGRNDSVSNQVVNISQGANAYWKAELASLYRFMVDNIELYEDEIAATQIVCDNYFAIGLDLNRNGDLTDAGDIAVGANLPTISLPVGSGSGTAVVNFDIDGSLVKLEATGKYNRARAKVVEEFSINNVNIWNNAVFANSGAGGATVQGRAEIRGAVHVLGQGLGPTDIALDISGSFGLGNTYRGLSASFNLPSINLTQPDPEDLCATLRVKAGKVNMGGSSQVGYTESTNPDPFKDQLRAIYTNDGFNGGIEGSNIFSENGADAVYDAGDNFQFPLLDDINPASGNTYAQTLRNNSLVLEYGAGNAADDRNNLTYYNAGTWEDVNGNPVAPPLMGDYYLDVSCRGPLFGVNIDGSVSADNPYNGFYLGRGNRDIPDFKCAKYQVVGPVGIPLLDLVITEVAWNEGNQNINYSLPSSAVPVVMPQDSIYVGGTQGAVTVLGADFKIDGQGGSSNELGYLGDGVIFTETSAGLGGDFDLQIDYLAATARAIRPDVLGKAVQSLTLDSNHFPGTTVVALVARNTIVSQGSQVKFAAAMYAETSIEIVQQTLVMGAMVTQLFDAGSQVPTVLFTPNLAPRLSDLVPGAGGTGTALSNVSWRRE